jgi:hypothetical protein
VLVSDVDHCTVPLGAALKESGNALGDDSWSEPPALCPEVRLTHRGIPLLSWVLLYRHTSRTDLR